MRKKLKPLFRGIAFCVGSAVVLSLFLNDDSDVQLVALFICLFAVTMTAFFWGRLTAILGAIAACVTFCFLLFPPLGSIKVADPNQRVAILAFLLLAVLAVRLAPPTFLVEGRYSRVRNQDDHRKKV